MADKKQNKNGALILLILLALGVFLFFNFNSNKPDGQASSSLTVTFYDTQGNAMNVAGNKQSIVNGVPNVGSIGVTATITNAGSSTLTCALNSITPAIFNAVMDKSSKVIPVGTTPATWSTSSPISVSSLEGAGATAFTINTVCTYNLGMGDITLPSQSKSFVLTVLAEGGGAAYTVNMAPTGLPTGCGNLQCEPALGEAYANCPSDCPPTLGYVKFRTSDNAYPLGSAIAVGGPSCGAALTKYGFSVLNTGSLNGQTCLAWVQFLCGSSGTALKYVIPGSASLTGFVPTGAMGLYSCGTSTEFVSICQLGTYGGITIPLNIKYSNTDGDKDKVSDSAVSTSNPAIEVTCT